jgi:hypothetical protein
MLSEGIYIILVAMTSVSLWIPSHFFNPAPCSVFVMLFSTESNSTLGLIGMVTAAGLLLIICLSLIVIAWDICRTIPSNRRSFYLEFDVTAMDPTTASHTEQVFAKKSLVCYALGIFCQYVCSFSILANSGLSITKLYNVISNSIFRAIGLRCFNSHTHIRNRSFNSIPFHASYMYSMPSFHISRWKSSRYFRP